MSKRKQNRVHAGSSAPKACNGQPSINLKRNGRGGCILYFCAFVVLMSAFWPLSLYNTFGNDLWVWSSKFLPRFLKYIGERRASFWDEENHDLLAHDLIWTIDRRSNLSLSEFIEKYDAKRPVLITDALTGWKASNWSKEFFVSNYGDQRVVMKAVHGSLSHAESLALPMKTFAKHSGESSPTTWTYIEDELFIQLHPELREHLGVPIYMKEDFFQLFPAEVRPWNAMLLWGTTYSRSYLHIDPYNWTGTNAVLSGKKLWKYLTTAYFICFFSHLKILSDETGCSDFELYPPGQDEHLYVIPNRKSEFPLNCFKYNSPVDAFNPDLKKYPSFAKARAISFEQNPGELLIIPPGWFHQAFNELETIAVSSQVMNSQNIHIVLEEIFKAGDVDRSSLPSDFHELSPADQVLLVMKSLPPLVMERGKEVTAGILKQMGYTKK